MTVGLLLSLFADMSSALDRVGQAGGLTLLMYRRESSTAASMMPKYCCLQSYPCLTVRYFFCTDENKEKEDCLCRVM
jgi:hypothetical protein